MTDKVLVTGGCGFIGANLVRRLLDKDQQVTVFDNLSKGNRDYIDGLDVAFIEGDIRDTTVLGNALDGVNRVVHLAAYGSVVESVEDPQTNFEMNVVGTFNVLNQAVKHNIEKLVFSSTGGALIGDAIPPVNEQSLPKPISPYGAGKLCAEAYCHAFSKSYGINTVCTRFANVYGPYSQHKSGVINQFFKKITQNEPLIIYGDGSSTRDYIHVADLCNGITRALLNKDVKTDVIHLASGRETSLRQLADLMIKVSGKTGHPIEYRDKRTGEVNRNFARYDYAQQVLGFEPQYTLEEGLQETWGWLAGNK
jgi:UDP-glucose 4-epimerase